MPIYFSEIMKGTNSFVTPKFGGKFCGLCFGLNSHVNSLEFSTLGILYASDCRHDDTILSGLCLLHETNLCVVFV